MRNSKITFIIALLSTLFQAAKAQHTGNGKISGIVSNGNNQPVNSASLSLIRVTDSTTLIQKISDEAGKFSFENIEEGRYAVKTSAIGYAGNISDTIAINASQLHKDITIHLKPTSKELSAVTVVAQKPMYEQHADKTVVNVDAAVTNAGATAMEVLEKTPGISVDKDGNISLKGKQGVTVMIDGRPTYLSASDLAAYLKSLPASAVDQIEIMTNPPAKYDAAGNSGIINFKTKKGRQKGFNGNLTATYQQGKYWETNNSLNLNYRTGKFNLFTNLNYSFWNGFEKLDLSRKFKDPLSNELTSAFEQTSNFRYTSKNTTAKLGADYFINKKTTIGIVLGGYLTNETGSSESTSYLQNKSLVTDSIVYATSQNDTKWKNSSVNLNFRHSFDTTGREFTADVDYAGYSSAGEQYFCNTNYTPEWLKKKVDNLQASLPLDINIFSAKADYVHPLGKDAKLETGVKSSYTNTDNAANYFVVDSQGNSTVDNTRTNKFAYKENINAAYISATKKFFNKLSVQAGLRFENTNNSGRQYGNPLQKDSSFTNHYNDFFPTVYFTYELNDKNTFTLNYGRRIDRPAYQDMNPFVFFIDQFTYFVGNPYLKPQYTNNIEFAHTYNKFLTTTLNYSHTKNIFAQTFEPNGFGTIVRRGNIGWRDNAGIAVSAQVPVRKWWSANVYANFNYNHYKGTIDGDLFDEGGTTFMTNINNQFKFKKGWSAELSGWYRTKGLEGQIVVDPFGQISAGIAKKIIKEKGSIKLNVRDIFYTQVAKGTISFKDTDANFRSQWNSRTLSLTFTYRFGKVVENTQQNRKTGGSDSETNRVKTGR